MADFPFFKMAAVRHLGGLVVTRDMKEKGPVTLQSKINFVPVT